MPIDYLPPRVKQTLASLFAPQASPEMQQEPQQSQEIDPLIQGLLNPQNESTNRLQELLGTVPQREDYQPSRMTNILGRIGGLGASSPVGISGGQPIGYRGGGLEAQKIIDNNLNRGYNQAMDSWDSQTKPLAVLSSNERAQNTNSRLTAATLLRDEKADKDRESKEEIAGNKLELDKDKLVQKREFAAIVKAKNEMPNAAMAEDKDGKVYTWDKKTGQFIGYLTNDEGGIVESSKLPEQEKLSIQQGNELQKIVARGSQSRQNIAAQGSEVRKTEGVRSSDTEAHIKSRGEEQRKTNEAKPVTPAKAVGSPKKNDEKVFPNGKVGRWDGQGWIDTGKTAK